MTDFTNSYKLGIPSIDEQHGKWIEMMKILQDAKGQPDKETLIREVLDKLCVYTDSHFAYEERLFMKHGYPEAKVHTEKHQKFLVQLQEFNDDVKNNNIPMNSLILSAMKTWLTDHICHEDKKYAEFLISKGVK